MKRFDDWLYERLSGPRFCDMPCPPGDNIRRALANRMYEGESVHTAATANDGFELNIWLTGSHRVAVNLRHEEARELAWFILWRWWVLGTWCGLRRKLWYGALRRNNARHSRSFAPKGGKA